MQIRGNTEAAHALLADLERVMREHGVDDQGLCIDLDIWDERPLCGLSAEIRGYDEETCERYPITYLATRDGIAITADDIRAYLSQQQREGEG